VGVSLKHFAANNHEWNRMVINVRVGERVLREIYLKGFEIAVREAKPWTLMTSYNKINGIYTSESLGLLQSILRDDWKFEGLVMTDWFGGKDPVAQMKAGNDLLMPGTQVQQKTLMAAVQEGKLEEAVLDCNLERILDYVLKTPSFSGSAHSDRPDLKAHAAVARAAAAQGMVLLKNERATLPLKPGLNLAIFGNTAYEMVTGGTGSGDVNEAYSISLLEGLKEAGFASDPSVVQAYASYLEEQRAKRPRPAIPFMLPPPIPERAVPVQEIAGITEAADMALIVIGRNSGEFVDRRLENDFHLNDVEKTLLQDVATAFHARKRKVAVILNIGGVIETASWRGLADAILLAWQPGQEAGHAIADVLSGKVNPSGKLATTFPLNYADLPASSNFPGTVLEGPDPNNRSFMSGDRAAEVLYREGIWIGYRHFVSKNVQAAYPFGYGLSYTQFTYEKAELDSKTFKNRMTAKVTVKNTGKTAGKEAVQLYISAPAKSMEKPKYELRAFAKTRLLEPGESETLAFVLVPEDLASFDAARSCWTAEPGRYTVLFGASSEDIRKTVSFKLAGEWTGERLNQALSPQGEI
jgi:beta-glucosidase